jgi:hypothetical protein
MTQQMPVDFVATLDYACEPTVNRAVYASNLQRIEASLANELACRAAGPDLPWLPILQGDSLAERAYELLRRRMGSWLPIHRAGIGSICGRSVAAARAVLRFYRQALPGLRYHAFGLDCRALDADDVALVVDSWDSYGWNWARGTTGQRTPSQTKQPGESYTSFVRRLADGYRATTVAKRIRQPRQLSLMEVSY